MEPGAGARKLLVIVNGTLIDGSGRPPVANQALVIEGERIRSVGPVPAGLDLRDDSHVEVIDAAGRFIMPGLIDAHTHLSYGYPLIRGEGRGRGPTRPELGVLKAARSAQRVLRAGVTSISVPGGTWFTDVGVRDAIRLGVLEGPRIHCAGRMIITYGSIEDDEPSWVGTPDHGVGVLCNSAAEMVTEVRRQCKHGVDFVKMADSRSGEVQTLAREEIAAVVDEAHRRRARVAIHSRGAGSTRAAAEAGVDWIIHADLAPEADLVAVAEAGIPILPTMTFLAMVLEASGRYGQEMIQMDVSRMKRHFDGLIRVVERARRLGITILCGTDTGNNQFMPFGELHTKELEILVTYCGFSPMDAIVAATRDNALTVGLPDDLGVLEAGRLADVLILTRDPLADIRVLQGGKHLEAIIKDGKRVGLTPQASPGSERPGEGGALLEMSAGE
jgi:imidazolonepropionase-like amidohydrolase